MVLVIAHRGASARHRENTVEAFREAARLGADGVELDVRRTAEGALVVHHDALLPAGQVISNMSDEEIPGWMPFFGPALDACDGLVVNVEVKNAPNEPDWDPAESVARTVAETLRIRALHERTIVSAFTLSSIDAVRTVDPTLRTGWLTLPGYDQLDALETAAARGHTALHPHHSAVTEDLVDAAHARGLALNTWTVDDAERIRELAEWGVDGIITNVPDLALTALNR